MLKVQKIGKKMTQVFHYIKIRDSDDGSYKKREGSSSVSAFV